MKRPVSRVKRGVSLLVTPELSLTGYPPEDLMLRKEFLIEVEHKLETLVEDVGKEAPNLTIVIGHPCFKTRFETRMTYYNSQVRSLFPHIFHQSFQFMLNFN